MTQTAINHISYTNCEKAKIRDYILKHAGQGKAYLELYGNGESYSIAKRMGINVLSIDDGRQENNEIRLKKELKGKGKMFISLQNLCKSRMKRKNDVIWLDYCGSLGKDVFKDIAVLPKIMTKQGTLFITFLCGRENILPKDTDREVINAAVIARYKAHMTKAGVRTRIILHKEYQSLSKGQKKAKTTRMIIWQLKWNKQP